MAAEQDVIRQFLVSLGFKVDETGMRKFTTALGTGTGGIANVALTAGKAVAGIAIAAETMVTSFALSMEKLYYVSKRTNSSVENIQGLEYGFRRVGLGAGAAKEALEAMAAAVRMNPGMRGLMDSLVGHSTSGMDQTKAMLELVQRLSTMPHYVGARFAQMFGMDEKTFLMVVQGLPELNRAMQQRSDMNKQAGIDAQAAAEASKEYANSIREIGEKLEVLGQKFSVIALPYFRQFNGIVNEGLDALMHFNASKIDLSSQSKEVRTLHDAVSGLWGVLSKINSDHQDNLPNFFKELSAWAKDFSKDALNVISGITYLLSGNWAKGAETLWSGMKGMVSNSAGTRLAKKGFDAVNEWRDSYRPGGSRSNNPISHIDRRGDPMAGSPIPVEVVLSTTAPDGKQLPLGLRQNNPGNLRSWGSNPRSHGFAQFADAGSGLSAMAQQLALYSKRGLDSVKAIISTYAPSSENDTSGYIGNVTKRMGVGAADKLDLKDPAIMAKLMDAMIRQEQGYNPFGSAELLAAAGGTAPASAGDKSVTIHQKTDIHVNGAANPAAIGAEVRREQQRVNGDLVRNFRPVVQ